MIEITCNKAERQRLTKVLLEGGCLWPQASKTCWIEGEDCRACINKRIRSPQKCNIILIGFEYIK